MTIRDEIRIRLKADGKSDAQIDAMFEAHRTIDRMGLEIHKRRKAMEDSRK